MDVVGETSAAGPRTVRLRFFPLEPGERGGLRWEEEEEALGTTEVDGWSCVCGSRWEKWPWAVGRCTVEV